MMETNRRQGMAKMKRLPCCWFGAPAARQTSNKEVWVEGGSRYAPLPWATFWSPLWGAEQQDGLQMEQTSALRGQGFSLQSQVQDNAEADHVQGGLCCSR
jgi:hypothetical protein